MSYKFSQRSLTNQKGVHPALTDFALFLLDFHDFTVISGVRTRDEQQELVESGASHTMNSKHLIQSDGYGHALDLWPIVNGEYLEDADIHNMNQWYFFGGLMLGLWEAFLEVYPEHDRYTLVWGGDWNRNYSIIETSFRDLFHIELKQV